MNTLMIELPADALVSPGVSPESLVALSLLDKLDLLPALFAESCFPNVGSRRQFSTK